MSEQKNSFTLSIQSQSFRWRREWDSNPRGRDAQRLSCQSTNIQMGSRGRRFNHSAIPAQPATKTERVLNHFQENRKINESSKARYSGQKGATPQGWDPPAEPS